MSLLSSFSFPSTLTSFLKNPLTNNPLYQNPTSRNIFFTIGAIYLLSKAFCWTKGILSLTRPSKNLVKRYGKGTWALISGASDGIGKGFAFELAKRGFNIVLLGRNREKLEQVEKEFKGLNPSVEFRIVIADFINADQVNFAERIYDQVHDLDISIIVNNAGSGLLQKYSETPTAKIKELVVMNCLSHALLTRVFLPKLQARAQKSAILNISSFSSYTPIPGLSLYSSTKVFLDYLSRGIAYEHPNMDIISLIPNFVSTPGLRNKKPDFETITTEEFVNSSLSALGNTTHTPGHWKHLRLRWILDTIPGFFREKFFTKRYLNRINKAPQRIN